MNNLVSIGYASLWSKCYATLDDINVEPGVFREIIQNSGMVCGNFENFSKYVCDGDPNAHKFSLSNCHKDIEYYIRMAEALGAKQPISGSVMDLVNTSIAQGMGDKFLPELVDGVKA